ncbi:hypothetical protein MNY66_07535 [Moellerella wisconsensis]|uniref:hypothetical protein n=1 Tax=Moellerella wisconsensis TaxID=158849 RepID=UPI001F4F0DD1|nr:hypothetical protein [Moellerella wisconsensis]UNH43803.1 hypothetical protein MNY66_07535 [Moellerella wisconsensis]
MKKSTSNNINLKLELIKAQAEANGSDTAKIKVITYDGTIELPEVDIVLIADGNALFKNVNTPIYKTKTGKNGYTIIDIVNNKDEKNTIKCRLFNEENISQSINISFYNELPILKIDSVYNINHTFAENEPSICWHGAFFYIKTKGGHDNGSLTWSADNEPSAFSFENISKSEVKVTITNEIKKENILTCIDSITQESIDFSIKIKKYVLISHNEVNYKDLINKAKSHNILKKLDYDLLFREWGIMSTYQGWGKDKEYWTAEHNQLLSKVYIYNLDRGSSHNVKMNDYKLNYLFTADATPL